MATLYEYYNTGDNASYAIYGDTWSAQTFTPATAHKITSVKLKLWRANSPGTFTVSIRTTDGSGHPTGGDLCVGTSNGNTLPTSQSPGWREITLGSGYDLSADTKYAIVIRALDGDGSNYIARSTDLSGTYANGNAERSTNGGIGWISDMGEDLMFEDWGEVVAEWKQLQYTSEPPTPNAWNQLKHTVVGGWNQVKFEGE